jgi:hypothetical protein
MKKSICLILVFIAILIIACNNAKKDARESPLLGYWERVYYKEVFPDTTYESNQITEPEFKIVTNKHWAYGGQKGINKVAAGGGKYTYDGKNYTEYINYHNASLLIGQAITYKSTLEGDLWTITGILNLDTLNIGLTETWKRVE